MDEDRDWAAAGLFSPSKARAQQAQAKDWAFVDSWLNKRAASKRLPTFERNEDTLQALLALATFNDAADEQRNITDRVEKAALTALLKRTENPGDGLHDLLLSELQKKSDVTMLAELSVLLAVSTPSALSIGTAIVDLGDSQFEQDQQLHRAEYQLQALRVEQERLKALLATLANESLQPPSGLPAQTMEWTRGSKHLRAKIEEYDDRLGSAQSQQSPSVGFDDIARQMTGLEEQSARLRELENELLAFRSLPSDIKGARSKLEAAREDLRNATKQRDALFEQLAGD